MKKAWLNDATAKYPRRPGLEGSCSRPLGVKMSGHTQVWLRRSVTAPSNMDLWHPGREPMRSSHGVSRRGHVLTQARRPRRSTSGSVSSNCGDRPRPRPRFAPRRVLPGQRPGVLPTRWPPRTRPRPCSPVGSTPCSWRHRRGQHDDAWPSVLQGEIFGLWVPRGHITVHSR